MAPQFSFNLVLSAVDRVSATLQKVEAKLKKVGAAASRAGRNIATKVGAPIAIFGALAVSAGANFEGAMLRVQALTGQTGDGISKLTGQAKELGRTTQFSATQVGEAQGALAQSGFKVNEIFSATAPVLNLAAAGQIELGRAAEIASGVLRGQRLEVGELTRVTDVLVGTSTGSANNIEDLAEAFKFAGPITAGFGISLEETGALLAKLGDNMIRGSMAGTTLRGSLAALNKNALQTRKALGKLNIDPADLRDGNGKLLNLIDIIGILERSGASAEDALLIFGKNAGPGMAALVAEGEDSIRAFADGLAGESGAGRAAEVAAVQMQGLLGVFRTVASSFEAMQIAIVEAGLGEWVENLGAKIVGFFQSVAKASPASLLFATKIALIAIVMGPALIGLGFMINALIAVAGAMKFAALGAVSLGKKLVTVAIPAVVKFTIALLSNPIGLVIALVAGLIAWLITLSDGWGVVGEAVKTFGRLIGGFLLGTIKMVVGWLTSLLELMGIISEETADGEIVKVAEVKGSDLVGAKVNRPPTSLAEIMLNAQKSAGDSTHSVDVNFNGVPAGVEIARNSDASRGSSRLNLGVAMEGVG